MDTSPWSRVKSELYALVGRNPRSNRRLPQIAGLDPSQVVLDVGCGPGAAVRAAATHVGRAVGVDRSEAMIEIARRRSRSVGNVEFTVGSAERLPFADGSFDRVWTIHSFHHWERPAEGLAEMHRVLRPGGMLLIIESDSRGSHGLDQARAAELVQDLAALGLTAASIAKPFKQLVVTARRGASTS